MKDFIRIRDPRFENNKQKDRAIRTLDSLSGKTMAILNNGWLAMNEIAELLSAKMKERYGVVNVLQFGVPSAAAAAPQVMRDATTKADFVIVGLAN